MFYVLKTYDFIEHIYQQSAWSLRTFGPGERVKGVIDHIKKELLEIEQKPHDIEEWIDVLFLAVDGAWRQGYSPEEIATAYSLKLEKNINRKWPDWRTAEPDKAIEHIRNEKK